MINKTVSTLLQSEFKNMSEEEFKINNDGLMTKSLSDLEAIEDKFNNTEIEAAQQLQKVHLNRAVRRRRARPWWTRRNGIMCSTSPKSWKIPALPMLHRGKRIYRPGG